MKWDDPRVVDRSELAQHVSAESCWIVIDGWVYDVTGFSHPGGWNRIFELAGQDATRAFKAVKHSAAAGKYMAKMVVGKLALDNAAPAVAPPQERPAVVNVPSNPRNLTEGSRHRVAKPGESMWSTRCRGFLPARDPFIAVPVPFSVLSELVGQMPAALADGSFRCLVDHHTEAFAPMAAAIVAEGSEEVLERVHALYGYLGKGYVLAAPKAAGADGAHTVPDFISAGWLAVSERLGRPPTIDYADCVLNNWQRIDPDAGITPENIRLLHRFTGLVDEEWFLKTHVIIESESAGCAIERRPTLTVPSTLAGHVRHSL